jgi:hypothetical protein
MFYRRNFKMKKRISLLMTLMLIVSMFSAMTASAAAPNAYFSDVRSFINNYPIQSYTIKSHTVVSTEQLKDYGFRVVWDGDARALYITREAAKPNWNPTKYTGSVVNYAAYAGDVAFKTVPTDIKVYINGQLVDSYNSGWDTFINLADLTKASYVDTKSNVVINKQWFADERQSFLWISDLPVAPKVEAKAYPYAYLSLSKAYEWAVDCVKNSIFAEEGVVLPKQYDQDLIPDALVNEYDKAFGDGNGVYPYGAGYAFTVLIEGVPCTVTVKYAAEYGVVCDIINVPDWLVWHCK